MTAFFLGALGGDVRAPNGAQIRGSVRGPARGAWMSITINPSQLKTKAELTTVLADIRALLLDWREVHRNVAGFPIPLTEYPAGKEAEVRAQQDAARALRDHH